MFLLVLCVLPLGTGSLLHWSYHKTSSPNHPPCAYGSLLLMLADLSRHILPCYVCASHSCNLWYGFLSLPHCKHLSSLTQSMSCCFVCVQAPDYPCKRRVCDSGVLAPPLSVLAPILRVISIYACYSAHVSRISFLTKIIIIFFTSSEGVSLSSSCVCCLATRQCHILATSYQNLQAAT